MSDVDEQAPPQPAPPPARKHRRRLALLIGIVVIVVVFIAGLLPRFRNRDRVRAVTAEQSVPYVMTVRPERTAPMQDIVLPGNVEAYTNAPILARASGYVRAWHADIGARVKQGQVLAELDMPEVEQQLQQARSTLAAARANLRLADVTAERFTGLQHTRAVSQQEVDNAVSSQRANQATVAANEANVRQLEQQLAYGRIIAPFDGIITARNVDVGDLVTAGSSGTAGTSLFQIARADRLRVYISVPEPFAHAIKPGLVAQLSLAASPGTRFTGTLVRTANAIDPTTRTLLAEIQIPNPTYELFSGAFAEVHLSIPSARDTFTIPVEALVFRKEGLHVATVVGDHVEIKPITPGRDFGQRIEVMAGLTGDEQVVVSPPDSIATGEQVRVTDHKNAPAVSTRQ